MTEFHPQILRFRLFVSSLLLVFLAATTNLASAQQPKLSPEKRTQIEAAATAFMASTHVPGISIAVVENGEYEWGGGFGSADLESNEPASEHTRFRLAASS